MTMSTAVSDLNGRIGQLHDISYEKDSILIFQVNRKTDMINKDYLASAMDALKKVLPQGKMAVVIGADINVYELAGEDAVMLKLKGII